jgi:hypothetical protein
MEIKTTGFDDIKEQLGKMSDRLDLIAKGADRDVNPVVNKTLNEDSDIKALRNNVKMMRNVTKVKDANTERLVTSKLREKGNKLGIIYIYYGKDSIKDIKYNNLDLAKQNDHKFNPGSNLPKNR